MPCSKPFGMIRRLPNTFAYPSERHNHPRTAPRPRLSVEWLEARDVPAAFVVNSTGDLPDADPGDGVASTGNTVFDGKRFVPEVTLRAAIQEANALGIQPNAHTIGYASLTDGSVLTTPMDDIRVPLVITGNGKYATTISRDTTAGNFYLFTVATQAAATDISVSFNNLTITGGRAATANGVAGNTGGAITNAGILALNNVDVRDSKAYQGGGIYNATTGVLTLSNCVLAANQAAGDGADGGAIYTTGNGRVSISDSILSGNSATGKGGAIHMNVQSQVTLFDTNLSNNTADEGGAVYSSVGNAEVIPFRMTGGRAWNNTAANGGAFDFSSSNARLDGVTLDNNSATDTGGAIFTKQNTLELLNCTFSDNTATRLGPHLVYVGVLGTSVWITRTNTPTLGDADLVQWVAP